MIDKIILNTSLIILLLFVGASYADIYKWVDDDGKVHFSDKVPANGSSSKVILGPENTSEPVDTEDAVDTKLFDKDSFRMPYRQSKTPYRFLMSSSVIGDEPVDRLSSIDINIKQKVFYVYVKLTGVESGKKYSLRIRVIDAKGELIFDTDQEIISQTNSIWGSVRITPNINIDEPGLWTIQGVLNGEKLFVERRRVNF